MSSAARAAQLRYRNACHPIDSLAFAFAFSIIGNRCRARSNAGGDVGESLAPGFDFSADSFRSAHS